MNILAIFATLAFVGLSQQQEAFPPRVVAFWKQLLAPHLDECIAETGVDPKFADRMIRYNEFPLDDAFNCYIKCIGGPAHLNFTSDDDELLVENLANTVGAPTDLIQHCKELELGKDACETMKLYAKCTYGLLANFQASNES